MRDSNRFRTPLLSVVIPVKHNSGTLKYTLQTVLNQDYTNLQVVISNNSMQMEVKNLIDEFSIMFKLDNRRFDKVKFVDYINN